MVVMDEEEEKCQILLKPKTPLEMQTKNDFLHELSLGRVCVTPVPNTPKDSSTREERRIDVGWDIVIAFALPN